MTRQQYEEVDQQERDAHLNSRTDVLSKSFTTDLWMKVIARAIDDLVYIRLLRDSETIIKGEDLEIESSALGFLFDDNHRIPIDDYTITINCISCRSSYESMISVFSAGEAECPFCYSLSDPKITEYDISTTEQRIKDISLQELLAIWGIEDISQFRRGVLNKIEMLVAKKKKITSKRAEMKAERKQKMSKENLENFETATEGQLSDFDKGIISVLDEIKTILMTKNRKYGNSATNPVRAFSKASPIEQIKVRIDDKISRLVRSGASIEEDEDVATDLVGYLVILIALNKGYISY